MSASAPKLYLVLPGLMDRLSDWGKSYSDIGRYPALETLLSKASVKKTGVSGYEKTLWQLFFPDSDLDEELPVARQLRHARGISACCADLVYLRADVSDLFLIEARHLKFTDAEISQIEKLVHEYVAEVGGAFSLDNDGRGVLSFDNAPALHSMPLSEVAGGGIHENLPTGEGSEYWHRLLNELQMLLHGSGINQLREQEGKTPLNGFWLWGGGNAPISMEKPFEMVCSIDAFTGDLATTSHIPLQTVSPAALEIPADANTILMVCNELQAAAQYDDVSQWMDYLADLERDLFVPLVEKLRHGTLDGISLYPCDGRRFDISQLSLRKFWNRPNPPAKWL